MSKLFQKFVMIALVLGLGTTGHASASDSIGNDTLIGIGATTVLGTVSICAGMAECRAMIFESINDALSSLGNQISNFGNGILAAQVVKNAAAKGISLNVDDVHHLEVCAHYLLEYFDNKPPLLLPHPYKSGSGSSDFFEQ